MNRSYGTGKMDASSDRLTIYATHNNVANAENIGFLAFAQLAELWETVYSTH